MVHGNFTLQLQDHAGVVLACRHVQHGGEDDVVKAAAAVEPCLHRRVGAQQVCVAQLAEVGRACSAGT